MSLNIEEETSTFYLLTLNRHREVTFCNNFNDNNCFVNINFHFIYHIVELKDFIIKYKIVSGTPKLIVSLITIIVSYENIIKNKRKGMIDPVQFRIDLANYFKEKNEDKYQLYKMEEPIEFLIFFLTFIHDNNNLLISSNIENNIKSNLNKTECNCIIHELFYLNILEKKFCENCGIRVNEKKYDENLFVFNEINIEVIINFINKNKYSFLKIKNILFKGFKYLSKEESSLCEKCKINLQRKLYLQKHGKYLILNLILNNSHSYVNIFKLYIMIPYIFNINELFSTEEKDTNLKFVGMFLFSLSHYKCMFIEENKFYIYDDDKCEEYRTYEDLIEHLIQNKYLPIAIFYRFIKKKKDEKIENLFEINETYFERKLKYYFELDEKNNNKENNNNIDLNNKWICSCKKENSMTFSKCQFCGKVDYGVQKIIDRNYSSKNKIIKLIPKEWTCNNCKGINSNDNDKCKRCGKTNNNIKRMKKSNSLNIFKNVKKVNEKINENNNNYEKSCILNFRFNEQNINNEKKFNYENNKINNIINNDYDNNNNNNNQNDKNENINNNNNDNNIINNNINNNKNYNLNDYNNNNNKNNNYNNNINKNNNYNNKNNNNFNYFNLNENKNNNNIHFQKNNDNKKNEISVNNIYIKNNDNNKYIINYNQFINKNINYNNAANFDTLFIEEQLGKDEIENQKKEFEKYEKKNKMRLSKNLDKNCEKEKNKEKNTKLFNNNNKIINPKKKDNNFINDDLSENISINEESKAQKIQNIQVKKNSIYNYDKRLSYNNNKNYFNQLNNKTINKSYLNNKNNKNLNEEKNNFNKKFLLKNNESLMNSNKKNIETNFNICSVCNSKKVDGICLKCDICSECKSKKSNGNCINCYSYKKNEQKHKRYNSQSYNPNNKIYKKFINI